MRILNTLLPATILALLIAVVPQVALGVKVTLFTDTPTHVDRAKDIIIGQCIRLAEVPGRPLSDGLDVWEVEVKRVVKGQIKKRHLRVVSLYPLSPKKTYLLLSLGGSAYGSEFLATPELSAVELPAEFDLARLDGKAVAEQVNTVFSARLEELVRERERLEQERKLLEQATHVSGKPEQISEAKGQG